MSLLTDKGKSSQETRLEATGVAVDLDLSDQFWAQGGFQNTRVTFNLIIDRGSGTKITRPVLVTARERPPIFLNREVKIYYQREPAPGRLIRADQVRIESLNYIVNPKISRSVNIVYIIVAIVAVLVAIGVFERFRSY